MHKLTSEMRAALQANDGGPVEFQDEETHRVYMLIEAQRMGPLPPGHEAAVIQGIEAVQRGNVTIFDPEKIRAKAREFLAKRLQDS